MGGSSQSLFYRLSGMLVSYPFRWFPLFVLSTLIFAALVSDWRVFVLGSVSSRARKTPTHADLWVCEARGDTPIFS